MNSGTLAVNHGLKAYQAKAPCISPGHKRRGMLSTFYDPWRLTLRKLDPYAVEKLKVNIVRVNKGLPF